MACAYTPAQISAFLTHIQLPQKYHPENHPVHDVAFLTALHVHTISAIPYENLSLHYSPTHTISIDPQHAFQKIVEGGRGRGGYCMEVSILFNHVLRGLGLAAYTAGVRIRLRAGGVPAGDFVGWRHIVNIVTLASGDKYVLDVGFGGDGPTKPLPLVHGRAVRNLGTQEVRLVREHIPLQTLRTEESKLWIYQYRNGADLDWNSFYAFAEFEFLHDDFEVVNWYTGCSPESFQKRIPMVVKFLRREVEGGEEEVYGKRMMVTGTVKENLGGKTKVVQECGTEDERIEALQRWFGITFTKEERDGIRGHFTELLMSP